MATVGATEFKAKCLELMDRVAERREVYVITKRGRPVAKLVPADPPKSKDIFGCMADRTEIMVDIEKPLLSERQWKELARQRSAQLKAAEGEWRTYGTISGKRTVGLPPGYVRRKGQARLVRARKRP